MYASTKEAEPNELDFAQSLRNSLQVDNKRFTLLRLIGRCERSRQPNGFNG